MARPRLDAAYLMIDMLPRPWAGTPRQWILVFNRKAATWWLNRLPIGRFRHVRAFGFVPEAKAWIFYDVAIDRTNIVIACDGDAKRLMAEWLTDAEAVSMPAKVERWPSPRLGFWCVQAMKHLIGLRSGALRPDALWHDCLANGGEIIANERAQAANASSQHRAGPPANPAGAAGAG